MRRTISASPPLACKIAESKRFITDYRRCTISAVFPSSPCAGRNENNTYGRRNASPTTVFCFITVGEGSPLPQCSKHSKRGYTRFDFCGNEQAKINTPTVGAFCERPRAHPADAPAHRLRACTQALCAHYERIGRVSVLGVIYKRKKQTAFLSASLFLGGV